MGSESSFDVRKNSLYQGVETIRKRNRAYSSG